jgi:SagB-type dehydrogenase family enzyme
MDEVDGAATSPEGDRFWQESLNSWRSLIGQVDDRGVAGPEPGRVRRHRDRPTYSLPPVRIPPDLGDIRDAFVAFRDGGSADGAPRLAAPSLSALLHFTYGLTRMDLAPRPAARSPYHRATPSVRGLFPTECYCWLPGADGLPAGFYAYDPSRHVLVLVRPMEASEAGAAISAATGTPVAGARAILLLTSRFARAARVYNSYAYRLCAQEAGVVTGNALMVAGLLGLRGFVHYRLRDGCVNPLLGLGPDEESPAAIISLYPWPGTGAPPPLPEHTGGDAGRTPPPADGQPGHGLDPVRCATLLDLDARSRRQEPRPVLLSLPRTVAPWPGGPSIGPLPDTAGEATDAAAALQRRGSGTAFGEPGGLPARDVGLAEIAMPLRHALDPHLSDLVPPDTRPPVTCYIAAPALVGVPDGFYRWCPETENLCGQAPGPCMRRLDELYTRALGGPVWRFNPLHRGANAVVYLAVDRVAAGKVFGDRAYRILHQEAGVIAQRVCVLSAAHGLAARIHNGYPAAAISALFGLPAGVELVTQIIIGRSRPGRRYQVALAP